jgi:hypothetical protein
MRSPSRSKSTSEVPGQSRRALPDRSRRVRAITRLSASLCQRSIREAGLAELSILKPFGARQGWCSLSEFLPGKSALAVGY